MLLVQTIALCFSFKPLRYVSRPNHSSSRRPEMIYEEADPYPPIALYVYVIQDKILEIIF